MIAYVTVGAEDIAQAERFYSAFLPVSLNSQGN